MASESLKTHRFKKALLAAAGPDAEYIKHSDRITAGVPDSTITLAHTVWFECKARPHGNSEPLIKLLKLTNRKHRIQMFRLWRLGRVNGGRAFYVVFEDRKVSLYRVRNPYREELEHVATDLQSVIVNTLLSYARVTIN